jgi:hypothetical protein
MTLKAESIHLAGKFNDTMFAYIKNGEDKYVFAVNQIVKIIGDQCRTKIIFTDGSSESFYLPIDTVTKVLGLHT